MTNVKIIKNNRYGDSLYFLINDDNTTMIISSKIKCYNRYPDGNSIYYSLIQYDGCFVIRLNRTIYLNKEYSFFVETIEDYYSGGDFVAFKITGRAIQK